MDRRYQVFVSSTYEDLIPERREVIWGLLKLKHIPVGMELFPASGADTWTVIERVIDESDYYLVLVAGRYGSTDDDGLSYTEREYEYAMSRNKPVIAFLHGDPGSIAGRFTETDVAKRDRLAEFRTKLAGSRWVGRWHTPENLQAEVVLGMVNLVSERSATGWIRADESVPASEAASLLARVEALTVELDLARAAGRSVAAEVEEFSHGADIHEVAASRRIVLPDQTPDRERITIPLTWDEIFEQLAPLMLADASESKLSDSFHRLVSSRMPPPPSGARSTITSVPQDEFQRVKGQLFRLRLIRESDRKHTVRDPDGYWTLSDLGREYWMQRSAIRRPSAGS
jgi:hypothetical protein